MLSILVPIAIVVVAFVIFPHSVLAQTAAAGGTTGSGGDTSIGGQITNGFFSIVAQALSYVVAFEGWLIAILVDVLVAFASYNGFAHALPVDKGWVLVRDIVNMFFIVVLLVSAFATVIGYDTASFHYSRVLPKLLLMAILINFSKTLIQLAIDFSQVLMLTFVNAFRSAAAGNFVQMFGLGQMLELRNVQDSATLQAIGFAQIIAAYLLAIVMLSIIIAVFVIMIAFFIARIVGLWLLLIFAPAAFFIQAVPARLKKGMASMGDEYWSKLGTLLAGGPIMAFFIWLALAITQNGGSTPLAEGLDLYTNTPTFTSLGTSASGFINKIGTPSQLASFVVGIAIMLIGLDAATKTAGAVSATLGGVARGVSKYAMTAPFVAGLFAARTAGRTARAGARKVDQRLNITGGLSRVGLATVGRAGIGRETFAKGVTLRRREREAEAARISDLTKGMTAEERLAFGKTLGGTVLATPAERLAKAKVLADGAGDDARFKATKEKAKAYEQQIVAQHRKEGKILATDKGEVLAEKLRDVKREANAKAMFEVNQEAAKNIDEAKKLLTSVGAKDQLAELNKMVDKSPALSQASEKDFNNLMAGIAVDPEKIKNLSPEALSRADVLTKLMGDSIIQRDPTTGAFKSVDQARFERFIDQNKDNKALVNNSKALVEHLRESPGIKMDEANKLLIQTDARGKIRMYDGPSGAVAYSQKELDAKKAVETSAHGRISAGVLEADGSKAWRNALEQGLNISDIRTEMNKDGAGTNDEAFDKDISREVFTSAGDASRATTDADFTKAWRPIGNISQSLAREDSAFQIRVLGSLQSDGAEAIRRAVQEGDNNQRKQAAEMIKLIARRAEEINRAGGAKNAEETALLNVFRDVKLHFPTSREEYTRNNPPGATGRPWGGDAYRGSPAAIRENLRGVENA